MEFETPVPAELLLTDAPADALLAVDWLRSWAVTDDGLILLRIQALVIDTGAQRIVVDTCFGNDKDRMEPFNHLQGPFLSDLSAAGYPRESIDAVICTHLHVDHVGWNTMLVDGKWAPTFPNARYFFVKAEVDGEPEIDGGPDIWGDSVQPIFDAGLADVVDADHQVAPGVRLFPTHGHTPGHVSVQIVSNGSVGIITGDLMHHPFQIASPGCGSTFDADHAAAEATRRSFLDRYADQDVLIIGTHFPAPTAGHLKREGDSYQFTVRR